MTHDDLRETMRSFVNAHGLPEPVYVTTILHGAVDGSVGMHFDAPPSKLGLDGEWRICSPEVRPFLSADFEHDGRKVGVIAHFEETVTA